MGGHSNEPHPLPEVHFSIVDAEALLPPHVDNKLLEDFGFNDGKPWTLIPSETITTSVISHPATYPVACSSSPSSSSRAIEPVASTSTATASTSTTTTTTLDGTNPPVIPSLDGATVVDGLTFEHTNDSRYLRWLQPMESELAHQVEYDMDEQDQVWLDGINASRKVDGSGPVSYEIFEIIVDKLEKEWFDLMKSIPKKPNPLLDTDSKCAICDDGECENSNAIVFCDGCNLAVHQDCYGVPYIPEGQWLCRKCTVSPDKPVRCVLCPNSYGAFKQTTTAHWAHLLCAIWIPDTGVSNTVYMEPIDGVENISKSRWKLICSLCRQRVGACIQCANRNCFTAFHVTCARDHGLELKMKQQTGTGELRAYCEKHSGTFCVQGLTPGSVTPLGTSRDRPGRASLGAHAPSLSTSLQVVLANPKASSFSTKTQRAYKKSYTSGPPLVPSYILDRVNAYVSRIKIANKRQFMNQLCRYWSLKRESRRGAPLLKRLHLEPWTASASMRQQSDVERAKKLELMRLLREDLENVRMLTERVRKRERKKLERAQLLSRFVEQHVFARECVMGDFIRRVSELDKHRFFAKPVSRRDAPDYYDIVKTPMDFSQMTDKLARREYPNAESLLADFNLIFDNAFLYNKKETTVYRAASKLLEVSKSLVEDLKRLDDPMSDENILGRHLDLVLTDEVVDALFEFDPAKPEEGKGTAGIVMQAPPESVPAVQEARKEVAEEDPVAKDAQPTTATTAADAAIISTATAAPAEPKTPAPATETTPQDEQASSRTKVEAEPESESEPELLPNAVTDAPSAKEDVVIEETPPLPEGAPTPTEPTPPPTEAAAAVSATGPLIPSTTEEAAPALPKKGFAPKRATSPTKAASATKAASSTKAAAPPKPSSREKKAIAKDWAIAKMPAESAIAENLNPEAIIEDTSNKVQPIAEASMDIDQPQPATDAPPPDPPTVYSAPTPASTVPAKRKLGQSPKRPRSRTPPPPSQDSTMSELSSAPSSSNSESPESGLEKEVEDVDDRKSFRMFDTGWVLPEGSSRKAKNAVVEKGKVGQSTAPKVEEKEKEKEKEQPKEKEKGKNKIQGKGKDVEKKKTEPDLQEPPKKKRGRPRKIRVEEVQGPEAEPASELAAPEPALVPPPKPTRRNSASSEVSNKAAPPPRAPSTIAKAAEDAAAEGVDETDGPPTTGASAKKEKPRGTFHGSMSIASTLRRVEAEMASKGLPPVPNPASGKKVDAIRLEAWEKDLARVEKPSLVTAETKLKEGDLIWAKSPGFPFFPAEVLDYPFTAPETRDQMRSHRPKNADADEFVPILFFDPYRTSRWAKRDDLRLLGSNDELDEMLSTYDASLRLIFKRKMSNAHPTASKLAEEICEAVTWAKAIGSGSSEARKKARVGKSKEGMQEDEDGENEEDEYGEEDEENVAPSDATTKKKTRSSSMSTSTAGNKRKLIEKDDGDHEETSTGPAMKKTKV
ncbi:BQ2448_5023 [Microbotryum intermedium]|uniref:BQ2448_5023 protein n=1 Tax=Microbotryum intermedium TaxID=269621 RepID=A0A238EZW3_9BASI|nr:BQ2448_5023 [Microbotryum intermedium]